MLAYLFYISSILFLQRKSERGRNRKIFDRSSWSSWYPINQQIVSTDIFVLWRCRSSMVLCQNPLSNYFHLHLSLVIFISAWYRAGYNAAFSSLWGRMKEISDDRKNAIKMVAVYRCGTSSIGRIWKWETKDDRRIA